MSWFSRVFSGDWVTHVFFGYLFCIVTYFLLVNFTSVRPGVSWFVILVVYYFSILPDLDTPASVCRRWTERVAWVSVLWFLWACPLVRDSCEVAVRPVIWIGLFMLLVWFMDWFGVVHRGLLHHPLTGLVFMGGLFYFSRDYWLCIWAGISFLSHLFVDRVWTWYKRKYS